VATCSEAWGKESYEIATKIAYRNGGRIGIPRGGNMDCTMVAAAPVLPAGYVVIARRIAVLESRLEALELRTNHSIQVTAEPWVFAVNAAGWAVKAKIAELGARQTRLREWSI
jgi:hypothetical protein